LSVNLKETDHLGELVHSRIIIKLILKKQDVTLWDENKVVCWALLNRVINFRVPLKAKTFLKN